MDTYNINVARLERDGRYHHFFKIEEEFTYQSDAMEVYHELHRRFPDRDGYSITVSKKENKWNSIV